MPFTLRFCVNDFAPHFGQTTSPSGVTCVDFIPAQYDRLARYVMAFNLTHPDSESEIEVEAAQVPLYLAQGWQTKPGATPPESPDQIPAAVPPDVAPANPKKK